MSISLDPNKGLRLKLGRYTPVRTWHGGGNFWSHEFQLTVRSGALAEFLPRAIEEDDQVLFEYRSGGVELAGASAAVRDMGEIPARQLKALRAAVEELKRKADDPHCDRTKRQMIQSFRLPDPQKDRDLYRLMGKGAGAKLIVLWGVEREEGSALAPGAAVDLLHTAESEKAEEIGGQTGGKRVGGGLLAGLVLLTALAAGGWYFWQERQRHMDQERTAAFNEEAVLAMAQEGALIKNEAGKVTGVLDEKGEVVFVSPNVLIDSEGRSAMPKQPGTVLKDDKGSVAGVLDKDGRVVAAAPGKVIQAEVGKPITAAAGTVVHDENGQVTGIVDMDGKVVGATPGTLADKEGKIAAGKPGSVFQDAKGVVTGVTGQDGKVVPVKVGAVAILKEHPPRPSVAGKGTSKEGGAKGNLAGKSGIESSAAKPMTTPGTLVRDKTGKVTGILGEGGVVSPVVPGVGIGLDGKVAESKMGTLVKDGSGKITGIVDDAGKVVDAVPGKVVDADDGKPVTAPIGTIVRGGGGACTGVVGPDGKVVPALAGTVLDNEGRILKGTPGSVYRNADGWVSGIAGTSGKVVDVLPGSSGDPKLKEETKPGAMVAERTNSDGQETIPTLAGPAPGSVTTPMTTEGPPPTGISSLSVISTSLSGVLRDGTVEVLLNVVARDLNGTVVAAPDITGWKVDGELKRKPDGQSVVGPVIPLSLRPGVHLISTVGSGADGKPFQTDAEVTVSPKE